MATETILGDVKSEASESLAASRSKRPTHPLRSLVAPLASLRLTVTLFFLAIVIILVGTLAQVDKNMWEVMEDYFRTWLAWVDLQIFFPRTWFPNWQSIPGGFYFPGGALIGCLMFINLLAAHAVRFSVKARGTRLLSGLATLAVGVFTVWLVVAGGHNQGGFQGLPWFEPSTLWTLIKVSLAVVWLAMLYGLITLDRQRWMEKRILAAATALLGGVVVWVFYQGDAARISESSMRILWQLIQGGLAASILLVGCVLLFKKRGGIVLLHAGVGLIMFNEWMVSQYAVEEKITMTEGQTVNYARDIRSVELAITDRSDDQFDGVVAIPKSLLRPSKRIQHEALPFDVEVLQFLKNSSIKPAGDGTSNLATAGQGQQFVAEEVRAGSGADSSGRVDEASLYARLFRKGSREEIGTYLFSQCMFEASGAPANLEETIAVDGTDYDVTLRFKRSYKPYSMHLTDVRKDDYLGTDTPMNYSSDVRLVDPTRNVDRQVRIWMNNPLRFAGETFYQSDYQRGMNGAEITQLQVVTNTGWMIPYVGCMIVGVGMLFQFSVSLLRFLQRREQNNRIVPSSASETPLIDRARKSPKGMKTTKSSAMAAPPAGGGSSVAGWILPLAVVLLCGVWLMGKARPPKAPVGQMDVQAFGTLPVVYQGRAKPLDTLARNGLRVISSRETFKDDSGQTQPAIGWLLDVITDSPEARQHKVFRITNLEVLETLGLERRKGYRYCLNEFVPRLDELEQQTAQARKIDRANLTFYQRKILELDRVLRTYMVLGYAFRPVSLPAYPSREQFEKDQEGTNKVLADIQQQISEMVPRYEQFLERLQPPLAVPSRSDEQPWMTFATAWHRMYVQSVREEELNPTTVAWNDILNAYKEKDVARFNRQVASYRERLDAQPPTEARLAATRFEALYNHFAPSFYCSLLYLLAFLLAAIGWLGWNRPLNRTATGLILLAFVVHTFAIVARVYISGRPPVTNLYTTAVFIGWGGVVFGLIIEWVYRIGIGNLIAAVCGSATLGISFLLAGDGDTFTVLQAVLDTQFWLTTHVLTINLGYAATFVAGLLGFFYILLGLATPAVTAEVGKDISRMVYGILCFAIFFSFIGTVLGGLWADDSWGRFWGWDPKENGALMIVLWNAICLHAYWGGLVKQRGLAVLAVGGNIVTSWSWFGVNELNVGLHSYGFTEGVLFALGLFVASQLAIMALAMLPLSLWWSYRRRASVESTSR